LIGFDRMKMAAYCVRQFVWLHITEVKMAKELAFTLINPYTISKSRTGGVIARFIGRTDLDLVGARMFGPSIELVREYSELVRNADPDHTETCNLIADYILRSYCPNPVTGKPRRVMLLVFEGEDAVARIWRVTGSAASTAASGETIRDTYGDYIVDDQGKVQYFEPAVLVAPNHARMMATLSLWARYSEKDGGIISHAGDVSQGTDIEKTLVLLKPDNFRFHSARPGSIIDLLSSSGLRIVGVKKFHMTVAQAEDFYGPVKEVLSQKFAGFGASRVAGALTREFGFEVPQAAMESICKQLGPLFAESQFESIVKFMTGYKPSECSASEKSVRGSEECLALVYEGFDAVRKIRAILGATDPNKASPGSVRREFGQDIMVNAAHASDSRESFKRELAIVKVEEDTIKSLVEKYCRDWEAGQLLGHHN